MSKNTPYSISIYLLLWVRWGNWNWVRTIDKNIVKDFYHIPTYVRYSINKVGVVDIWNADMWNGVVKENHIWWNTINQGILFHPYVKNVPLLISSFTTHQWVIELCRNYTNQLPYTCNVSWHIFRVIE